MRTKALVLTAALTAAGLLNSLAAVYSVNVVGYVNVTAKAGFNLMACPLKATPNTVADIVKLPASVSDAALFKWNGAGYDVATYFGEGMWLYSTAADMTLSPGDGFFLSLPAGTADVTITFVGEVTQGADSNMSIDGTAAGKFSLIGSKVPQSLDLNAMAFPASVEEEAVYFWRRTASAPNGGYVIYTYFGGTDWLGSDATQPALPTPLVGEGFFVFKKAAGTWTRNFVVQ